jgi:hypothetical protein
MYKKFFVSVISFVAVGGATLAVGGQGRAKAEGFYDIVDDNSIAFMEQEVLHEQVVSSLKEDELKLLAQNLNASQKKVKYLVCLKYMLMAYCGENISLSELNTKNDIEIVALTLKANRAHNKTLSDSERKELKKKYKESGIKFGL